MAVGESAARLTTRANIRSASSHGSIGREFEAAQTNTFLTPRITGSCGKGAAEWLAAKSRVSRRKGGAHGSSRKRSGKFTQHRSEDDLMTDE